MVCNHSAMRQPVKNPIAVKVMDAFKNLKEERLDGRLGDFHLSFPHRAMIMHDQPLDEENWKCKPLHKEYPL